MNTNATNHPYNSLPQLWKQNEYVIDPISILDANVFGWYACWQHSNFVETNWTNRTRSTVKYSGVVHKHVNAKQYTHPVGAQVTISIYEYTRVLTAATLIHTIWAGITAAAGTRRGLQFVRIIDIESVSFILQYNCAMYCYLLSLPMRHYLYYDLRQTGKRIAWLLCSVWTQTVNTLPVCPLYLNDVQLEVSDKLPQRCQFAKHKHPKHIQVTVCPNATLYLLCMCFPPWPSISRNWSPVTTCMLVLPTISVLLLRMHRTTAIHAACFKWLRFAFMFL